MKLIVFLIIVFAVLIAVSVHEAAHALVAYKLGDPTAKYQGRLTLNPFKHLDIFGSFLVPLFLYISTGTILGWGKPVPVNSNNFRDPRKGSALVSLAGPLSNLGLALLLALPVKYLSKLTGTNELAMLGMGLLETTLDFSILFFVFNLLPFPPLDGANILGLIIPKRWQYKYDVFLEDGRLYFMAFILFDMMVLKNVIGFSIIGWVIFNLTDLIKSVILLTT